VSFRSSNAVDFLKNQGRWPPASRFAAAAAAAAAVILDLIYLSTAKHFAQQKII
jgi:hypothetical protein